MSPVELSLHLPYHKAFFHKKYHSLVFFVSDFVSPSYGTCTIDFITPTEYRSRIIVDNPSL
ncbi:hypothetical protein Hdeb2414_s0007g00233881 [Helianthus debilis subsp. tardiflorus]